MTSAHDAERMEAIASEERAMLDAYAVLVENLIDLIADWENRASRQFKEADEQEEDDGHSTHADEIRTVGKYYMSRAAELKKAME